ncbi:hypothetical protein SUGI_0551400 [Cryptomeria japonica]|nr:hypothetical protein SUGI_0551400 [Cryptomeria japonica]
MAVAGNKMVAVSVRREYVYGVTKDGWKEATLSYGKFNSYLNAGLLNPSSSPPWKKLRSSPTLFEMMAHEELQPK